MALPIVAAAGLGVRLTSGLIKIKAKADIKKAVELAEETHKQYNIALSNVIQSYNQVTPTLQKYQENQIRCFGHISYLVQVMEMTDQIGIYERFPQAKVLKNWDLRAKSIEKFTDTDLDVEQILLAGLNTTNRLLTAVTISSLANAIYLGVSNHSWETGINSFYGGFGKSFSIIFMAAEVSMSCNMANQASQALIAAQEHTVETKAIIANLDNLSSVVLPRIENYVLGLISSISLVDQELFNLIIELDTMARKYPLSSYFSEKLGVAIDLTEYLLKIYNTPILGKNEKIIVDTVTILENYHSKYFGVTP